MFAVGLLLLIVIGVALDTAFGAVMTCWLES
jgi:hypothetical protein